MPKKTTTVEYTDFTRGLITEVNPLSFPDKASLDELNTNLNRNGSRQRRYGFDWTAAVDVVAKTTTLASNGYPVNFYEWRGVNSDASLNILVLQHGTFLHFFDMDASDPTDALLGSTDLGTTFTNADTYKVDFTDAAGELVMSVGSTYVMKGVWNGTGITTSNYRLLVRDIWGIDDGFAVDDRTGALSISRHYNLRNQGWPTSMISAQNSGGSVPALYNDPVTHTFTQLGVYPSHSDLCWACKMSAVTGAQTDNIGAFSPWDLPSRWP